MAQRLRVGTSGFSYKEWKGEFYPEDLKAADMLRYYSERLSAVEINNTFYRMPRKTMLEGWSAQVPDGFVFVLKASRRITHQARLEPETAGDSLDYLWNNASVLGEHLGPILFQLPPNMKLQLDRLRGFLARLPDGCRAAFEFRNATWFIDEVYDALRDAGAALCVADTDDHPDPEIVATADWGYVRLRREAYSSAELAVWAARIAEQSWADVFVFFKHDDGVSPVTAVEFAARFSATG